MGGSETSSPPGACLLELTAALEGLLSCTIHTTVASYHLVKQQKYEKFFKYLWWHLLPFEIGDIHLASLRELQRYSSSSMLFESLERSLLQHLQKLLV